MKQQLFNIISKTVKITSLILLMLFVKHNAQAQVYESLGSGLDSNVYCLAVYNNELYAGGMFTTAGGASASYIAKWNGSAWSAVGGGVTGGSFPNIYSMVVFNNELYVGGGFNNVGGIYVDGIAKWNGSTWSAVGSGGGNGLVFSLAVYNNELYASGNNNIVKWNGSAWSAAGTGTNSFAQALTVYNNELYAGGNFTTAGGISANNIAKWNGSAWGAVGTGTDSSVYSLAVYNNELYAGGRFNTAGGISANSIAKWNGSIWSALGTGTDGSVSSMTVYNNELYTGGFFSTAGGINANYIAKWNGAWYSVGAGTNRNVFSMVVHNGDLYIGGAFTTAFGINANRIVKLKQFIPEPTSTSTNIQFTNVSTNSLSLTWNNGNGSKHLVVCKSGSLVNQQPVDGQPYSANTSFGSGSDLGGGSYIVYNSTGNSVIVNNLNPDNIYHFAIYEFNDSTASGFENYLIPNYAIASHTTLASEPSAVTNQISFSNASFTTMNVSLTPGNGTKRIVVAKQGSAVNSMPTDTFSYNANSFFGTSNTDMGGGNYVVYDGTGNSFNLTGLTANTIYHFASFEYNGSTIPANNYITSNPAIGYQSTLTTEPTTPSTNIQFTNVKDSSMTLSWTVGNGQRRMVVAATSVVTSIPVDGVDHLAKDTFGLGADLGFNNYVVYSGTSNTFNLKGLMPDITYHFAIFEYSGTNTSNNYLLMNPAIGSKSTLIAEPDVPASNLTLSPITNGITTVNWTNGNGVSRIAVVRQGMPINILPDDGNSYTANAVFGSGQDLGQGNFICYVGNSNTFNLQGLDPLNVYYVGIIEYNGSGGGTNYMLNNFPIADNLPVEPTVLSSNMSFSDLTSSSVKVSWTNGDGSYRLLLAKENAPVSKSPVDGAVYVANSVFGSGADLGMANFAVYNGIGNSAVITNLNEGSTYHFSLFEFNKDASGPANYLDSALDGNISILTRIQQNATEKTFEIYPNPGKGEFMVEIQNTKGGLQDAKIVITNILGETIYQSPVATGPGPSKTFIDLSSYSSGIFNLQLISTQGILTTKIVLE